MKQTVFAAIGIVSALVAAPVPLAAEPLCMPLALVEGDPVLVSSLEARLAQRGIAIDEATPGACPAVRAAVIRQGNVVFVTLTEPSGASVERAVTTADIAATWIESRARVDVGAPLLAVRASAPAPALAPAPGATAPVDVVAVAAAATAPRDPLSLSVLVETGAGDEDSSWRSYSASVCARLGPVCVGALGRLGDNPEQWSPEQATVADRSSKELLLTMSAPLRVGRMTVLPSAGAGLGWITTKQIDEPLEPFLAPDWCATDPDAPPEMCELPPPLRVTSRGGRFEVGLSVSIPIADSVALELGVSHQWIQGARSEGIVRETDFEPDPTRPGECGPDGGDPAACPPYPPELLSYPGEPTRILRGGLGLRVGLP